MHKGLAYPFHPTYWATETWFYPGFVPWKLTLDVRSTGTPPWNIYPALYQETSVAGVPGSLNQSMRYEFRAHAPAYGLIATLDWLIFGGVKSARWRIDLVSSVATWAWAIQVKPSPQRSIFNSRWPFYWGTIAYPAVGEPPYTIRPATYQEGGSPWPDRGPP